MRNLLRNLAYASVIVAATTVTVIQFQRPAEAQSPGRIVGAVFGSFAFASNGDVFQYTPTPGGAEIWTLRENIPGMVSAPAEAYPSGSGGYKIVCENGDVFWWGEMFPGRWMGNIFGASGPVNVEPSTWSRIKAGR